MSDHTDTSEKADPPGAPTTRNSLPANRLSFYLDGFVAGFGKVVSWLWIATLAVVLSNVFSRFIMGRGSIALEELSWHLFGTAMMLTLAYAVVTDDHVRVDVFRERFSAKVQAWIELLVIILLLLPILYLVIESVSQYAYRSFERGERSQAPSGLPYRFIIKSMLPVGMALVAVAIFSRALRCSTLLFGFPRPFRRDDDSERHPGS